MKQNNLYTPFPESLFYNYNDKIVKMVYQMFHTYSLLIVHMMYTVHVFKEKEFPDPYIKIC